MGVVAGLAWPYWVGVALIGAMLAYENSLLKPNDLSKLNVAFFNMNGYVAMTALVFTIAGVWLG